MTPETKTMPLALYNPALLPPEVLLAEFTARQDLLKRLLDSIRGNLPGHPPQHLLLIGPRGMGKTTTLWAVAHSVARDMALAQAWQPVVFDEESRRVGDLADFWLECLRQWETAVQDSAGRAERLLDRDDGDLEATARQDFLSMLDASGKRAVLLIDNLNELFVALPEQDLHRLRAFLMEDSRVMLIGTATRYFDDIAGVDRPFFDFFRPCELRSLTLEEMRETLLTLAERRNDPKVKQGIQQRPGTVKALHLLTGGNPRLVKTFYRMLAEGIRGDIRADLEVLLDDFTPYFKAILDALPVQQQRIVDAVALAWDPVEVASIAKTTRLPSNQVSAQLRALVRAGVVAEAAGRPKRKTYLMADRFSNIHYLMRHGRAARRRFDWFVRLLQALFPDSDGEMLAGVVGRTVSAGSEGVADARELLASALTCARSDVRSRNMVDATIKELWQGDTLRCIPELFDEQMIAKHFQADEVELLKLFASVPAEVRRKMDYDPKSAKWWYNAGHSLATGNRQDLAERCLRKATQLDWDYSVPWNGLGNVLFDLQRLSEAQAAYRRATELDPKDALPWNGLGNVLFDTQRPIEAEVAYRRAIELDPKDAYPWNGLGNVLFDLQRLSEAEAAYRRAVELDPKDANAWIGLGNVLFDTQRLTEAEVAYRKAIELAPKEAGPCNNLGNVLRVAQKHTEAEEAYRKALELDPKLAKPRANLASLLLMKDPQTAESTSLAIEALKADWKDRFAQGVFLEICGMNASAWNQILPLVANGIKEGPWKQESFEFGVEGFVRLAALTSPQQALAVLGSAADSLPFETLRDALRAAQNKEVLQQLAPERRALAIEILKRIEAHRLPKA